MAITGSRDLYLVTQARDFVRVRGWVVQGSWASGCLRFTNFRVACSSRKFAEVSPQWCDFRSSIGILSPAEVAVKDQQESKRVRWIQQSNTP